ncbi:integrase [Cryobacterium sp. MDB1-18-2]|uniref:tyrosine-type recombinase/integrase n=1 Tax=unclassified Cryobacterium TaxID=2649013 RepID=UPI00106995C1|nr:MULTISPECIES: tyrosine-type recombinase/integrase [unclassified Cryobacterium]TFC34735.1 integrase [Cryobacterium sp. MDB1-18-2]TFC44045.1 integrase [Cryobacterium sp. MDB1-18-1]
MTAITATVQMFFSDRLAKQRQASGHTVAAYRDTLRLLFAFVQSTTGKLPSHLDWSDLDQGMISAFLDHLETSRHNSARTRNARLGALRSLFRYAALQHPEHADVIARVLAIPPKRFDKATVSYLTAEEVDALLAAPDLTTWEGRRDHTWLMLCIQTGLRVSELTGLNCADISCGTGSNVRCHGKGRKDRAIPLTAATEAAVRYWLRERAGLPTDPLFCTRTGRRLTRDAIEHRLAAHHAAAVLTCGTLQSKKLSPHTLRHTTAMTLLHAGVDTTVIALWLGHADTRSTDPYIHADMTIKERALAKTTPVSSPPGRYRPADSLLAFLEGL